MINYNVDNDGIATITWDMPGRTMNVLNEASMTAYAEALDKALKDESVKGIILTSGKADFIAGADLDMLLNVDTSDATKLMEQFSQLQRMFPRQETGGKPMVAAINGTALGGGFEICLACHHRVASDNPKAQLPRPLVVALRANRASAGMFSRKGSPSSTKRVRSWRNAMSADLHRQHGD